MDGWPMEWYWFIWGVVRGSHFRKEGRGMLQWKGRGMLQLKKLRPIECA